MNENKLIVDSDFCALFLLPQKNTSESLSNVFSSLAILSKGTDGVSLRDVFERTMHDSDVNLLLPRFRMSYGSESLKPQLKSMGIQAAFGEKDQFLQMSEDSDLYLGDVFHKAVMEVTEEGTVAAAVTMGLMPSTSPSTRPPP